MVDKRSGADSLMKNLYEKGNSGWYTDLFSSFENGLNGQLETSFHKTRKKALQNFQETGFPTTRHEEWKYTNLAPLLKHDFQIPAKTSVPDPETTAQKIEKFRLDSSENPFLVFIRGAIIWFTICILYLRLSFQEHSGAGRYTNIQ